LAVHDPGKVLLDLVNLIALGGDCLADLGVVRAQPDLLGQVGSDPTVSRLVDRLAGDVYVALHRMRVAAVAARTAKRAHRCPVPARGLVPLDLDWSLEPGAWSLAARVPRPHQRREGGGREPLAAVLRAGSATLGLPPHRCDASGPRPAPTT